MHFNLSPLEKYFMLMGGGVKIGQNLVPVVFERPPTQCISSFLKQIDQGLKRHRQSY